MGHILAIGMSDGVIDDLYDLIYRYNMIDSLHIAYLVIQSERTHIIYSISSMPISSMSLTT